MFFTIELVLSIVAMGIFCWEDRRRRKYHYRPVWTNTVSKVFVSGLTTLLVIIFTLEDGALLVNVIVGWGVDRLNASICAALVTLWGFMLFGIIAYLLIIPDDDPDMQIIADAVYYDGNDD